MTACCHSELVEESNESGVRSLGYARDDKCSALLVDPQKPEEIAEATYKLISDSDLRNGIIEKGKENMKRFSWDKCAEEIAGILTK